MVTSLYSQKRAKCLSESELRGKCRIELSKMAKRIKAGECIQPPRPLVEKLYAPVSTDTALEHIMRMRAMLKAKGIRH